ncbi:retrovirus-related pol polyprotein from transposon TNT 1-94, partial [Tanacetum coccineum]
VVQIVLWYLDSGCSRHMTGDRARLINFVEKFIGTVRFGNDDYAAIIGYGDYKLGDTIISRVYYVEGLKHNLFYVGQFCDGGLEVAFRQHSCHIRNFDMVDLLNGSRTTNLYSISLNDMLSASPVCLLTKASLTKSWLWHRRLNHLNFGTLNELARKNLVRGLPMLKYDKDHLCPSCQKEYQQERKYVLVIVDDYTRFGWVRFLQTKDETPQVIEKFIVKTQRALNATVRFVRTDNGTEFVNKTLDGWFESAESRYRYFVGYAPPRRRYRYLQQMNAQIRKTFHVAFDELTEGLTSVQTSSGLAPQQMTSVSNSTELELTALQSGTARSALLDEIRRCVKNKARLVAEGLSSGAGLIWEAFAPVASIRIDSDSSLLTQRPDSESLYGLKQAPRAWYYDKQSAFLIKSGFTKGVGRSLLSSREKAGKHLLLEEILKMFVFDSCTPMTSNGRKSPNLDADKGGKLIDPTRFRGMAMPTEMHLTAIKRIFRYLKGTINMGLWYSKDSGFELKAFADADYAGCHDTRRSGMIHRYYQELCSHPLDALSMRGLWICVQKISDVLCNQVLLLYACNSVQHSRLQAHRYTSSTLSKTRLKGALATLLPLLGVKQMSPETLKELQDESVSE